MRRKFFGKTPLPNGDSLYFIHLIWFNVMICRARKIPLSMQQPSPILTKKPSPIVTSPIIKP